MDRKGENWNHAAFYLTCEVYHLYNFRSSETRDEDKDNMQITIEKNEDGTSRKVARDVDIDNFTVLDQVNNR